MCERNSVLVLNTRCLCWAEVLNLSLPMRKLAVSRKQEGSAAANSFQQETKPRSTFQEWACPMVLAVCGPELCPCGRRQGQLGPVAARSPEPPWRCSIDVSKKHLPSSPLGNPLEAPLFAGSDASPCGTRRHASPVASVTYPLGSVSPHPMCAHLPVQVCDTMAWASCCCRGRLPGADLGGSCVSACSTPVDCAHLAWVVWRPGTLGPSTCLYYTR